MNERPDDPSTRHDDGDGGDALSPLVRRWPVEQPPAWLDANIRATAHDAARLASQQASRVGGDDHDGRAAARRPAAGRPAAGRPAAGRPDNAQSPAPRASWPRWLPIGGTVATALLAVLLVTARPDPDEAGRAAGPARTQADAPTPAAREQRSAAEDAPSPAGADAASTAQKPAAPGPSEEPAATTPSAPANAARTDDPRQATRRADPAEARPRAQAAEADRLAGSPSPAPPPPPPRDTAPRERSESASPAQPFPGSAEPAASEAAAPAQDERRDRAAAQQSTGAARRTAPAAAAPPRPASPAGEAPASPAAATGPSAPAAPPLTAGAADTMPRAEPALPDTGAECVKLLESMARERRGDDTRRMLIRCRDRFPDQPIPAAIEREFGGGR